MQSTEGKSLAALAAEQRTDAEKLRTIHTSTAAAIESAVRNNDPGPRLDAKLREIRAKDRAKVDEIRARIAERTVQAADLVGAADPGQVRLRAALRSPLEAAALTARLALVPPAELAGLARQAAKTNNALLADAVMCRLQTLDRNEETVMLSREVGQILDAVDVEEREQLMAHARDVRQGDADARIIVAEFHGKPMSPVDRLSLIRMVEGAPASKRAPGPTTLPTDAPATLADDSPKGFDRLQAARSQEAPAILAGA